MADRFAVIPNQVLDGPLLLQPQFFGDDRGFFCETFRRSDMMALGIEEEMVQDNHSRSVRGVVRGMHFHVGRGVTKLVRCGRGAIADVLVDLRADSSNYRRWESFELSDENLRILYVPVGFGHGFCVVSDVADVFYKQDRYYDAAVERGIRYDDPAIGIEWPLPVADLQISARDAEAPLLADIAGSLPF
ncbi:MAG: dTDP-4-dehydrorhamnose 3,5-epimerase [Actinomycetota bacterium]|nr:dTDP-4-dehydrorhamnose 3,5-epimerase [Actinomycetota bacterium]